MGGGLVPGYLLIQTMYQMFFPMCTETPLALVLEVANVKDSIAISHESMHKQETNTQLPSSSGTSCFTTIQDNLAPTAPSAQDVPMDTIDVTSDSDEQANLTSTTHVNNYIYSS